MARKNVSLVVSGAGWIAGFADKLIRELRARNISDERIHSLVTDDGDVTVGTIADALAEVMNRAKNLFNLFRLTVDHALSVEEMVAVGKYDWVNSDITHKHFPHNRKRGAEEVVAELIHYNRGMSSDDALADFDSKGLRPATLPELLALGEKHPDIQREFPVAALGSVWQSLGGSRFVACLYRRDAERCLGLIWFGLGWASGCRFLAVRK